MTINLKNLTLNNVRIRIVPRAGGSVTLGAGNKNPATFIDDSGELVGCVAKPIFHCVPMGIYDQDVTDPASQIYYYWNGQNQEQRWAITATTEMPNGFTSTRTYRWKRADRNYSDSPLWDVVDSAVKIDGGSGTVAHFQEYSDSLNPAGIEEDDPETWVVIRWYPTPDLAEGEADYFTECIRPQIGEDELMAVSCGMRRFPGM